MCFIVVAEKAVFLLSSVGKMLVLMSMDPVLGEISPWDNTNIGL